MPNPYLLLGGLIGVLVLCLGSGYEGSRIGANGQLVKDTKIIEAKTAEIAEMQEEAEKALADHQNQVVEIEHQTQAQLAAQAASYEAEIKDEQVASKARNDALIAGTERLRVKLANGGAGNSQGSNSAPGTSGINSAAPALDGTVASNLSGYAVDEFNVLRDKLILANQTIADDRAACK